MKPMSCHEQEHPELAAAMSNNGFDWLEDSISFLARDVDIAGGYGWWSNPAEAQQDDIGSVVAQTLLPPAPLTTTSSPLAHASPNIASPPVSSPSEPSSKKRKSPAHKASNNSVSNQRRRAEQDRPGAGGGKKGGSKGGGAGSDRDTRWAEQLLYPCAAAVEAGNLSRAQHLFYVLGELRH